VSGVGRSYPDGSGDPDIGFAIVFIGVCIGIVILSICGMIYGPHPDWCKLDPKIHGCEEILKPEPPKGDQ